MVQNKRIEKLDSEIGRVYTVLSRSVFERGSSKVFGAAGPIEKLENKKNSFWISRTSRCVPVVPVFQLLSPNTGSADRYSDNVFTNAYALRYDLYIIVRALWLRLVYGLYNDVFGIVAYTGRVAAFAGKWQRCDQNGKARGRRASEDDVGQSKELPRRRPTTQVSVPRARQIYGGQRHKIQISIKGPKGVQNGIR